MDIVKQVIVIQHAVDKVIIKEERVKQHITMGVNMDQNCLLSAETFVLGTSVKILDFISVPTVTSALITLENPSGVPFLVGGVMTKSADGVYCYVWPSAITDPVGVYEAIITLMYDGKPSVAKKTFTMVAQ